MSVFRLQTFDPTAAPKPAPSDVDADKRRREAEREEVYRAGFIAGQSEATETFLEDQSRLTGELIEALNDAAITNDAARRHVAASLAPVIGALFDALTPTLAEMGAAVEIVGLVSKALETAPNARPRLRCAPELTEGLRAALDARGIEAKIDEAPELLPREAELYWDQGYDHLDLDACLVQIRECLATHLTPESGTQTDAALRHG